MKMRGEDITTVIEQSNDGYLVQHEGSYGTYDYTIREDALSDIRDADTYDAVCYVLEQFEIICTNLGIRPSDRREKLLEQWKEEKECERAVADKERL